jgi:uncharacterized protein
MKIDLFKLNNFNKLDIDSDVVFDSELYGTTDVRAINSAHVSGRIVINVEDELEADLLVTGEFILPCAVTLEDVSYKFETKIDENLGKFEDFYNKNKNSLDILPVLWENIVLEVPIRVVKDGVSLTNMSGEGWELVSND